MLGSGQLFQTSPGAGEMGLGANRPGQASSPFFTAPQQQQGSNDGALLTGPGSNNVFSQSATPSLLGNSLGFSAGGEGGGGLLQLSQGSSGLGQSSSNLGRPLTFGSSLNFSAPQQQQQPGGGGLFGSGTSSSSPSPFSSGPTGSIFGASSTSSSVLPQQQPASGSLFSAASLWSTGSGSTPSPAAGAAAAGAGGGGMVAAAAGDPAKQAQKSLGAKCIDTWKFLVAAQKAGVWPFSSVSAAEGEASLFVGLDLSIDEHRYLFYQQPRAAWPALQQRCEQQQLEHVINFYREVQRQAAAEGIAFDAPPPTEDFFHPAAAAAPGTAAAVAGLTAAPGSATATAAAATASPSAAVGQPTSLGDSQQQQQQPQLWPAAGGGGAAASFSSPTAPEATAIAAPGNTFGGVTSTTTPPPQQSTQQQSAAATGLQMQQQQQADYQKAMMAAFLAPAFEAGKVPDVAPPKELC